MRPVLILLLAVLSHLVWAQWSVGFSKAVRHLQEDQRTNVTDTVNQPIQDKKETLPEQDPEISQKLRIVHADYGTVTGTKLSLLGKVVIEYKGYRLESDKIIGDTATQIFDLIGKSTVTGKGDIASATGFTVNFETETYTLNEGRATISEETIGNGVEGPFFVSAGTGSLAGGHIHIINGEITSCDNLEPHFIFQVGAADIEPGRYLKMEDFKLKVGGRTIIGIEDLYIPLFEDRPRYTPTVGQSREEGYYIKSQFTSPINSRDFFTTRVDLMSKLGIGLGGDYNYLTDAVGGALGLYTIFGSQPTLLGRWVHKQMIGQSALSADAHYSKNNYLTAPDSALFNARFQLNIPGNLEGRGTSAITGFRSSSENGNFSTTNEAFGLADTRTWASGLNTTINLNYANNQSTSGVDTLSQSKRLDIRFHADQPLRSFRAELLYQRAVPIGEQTFFNNASDQTPLLTLSTDERRLFGTVDGKARSSLPFNLAMSIGELRDAGLTSPVTRMAVTFATQGQFALQRSSSPDPSDGDNSKLLTSSAQDTTLGWQANFYQGIYSDDTAQYSLQYGANFRHKFGLGSVLDIRYQTQRQFGYTPLAIDRRYRNDSFTGGLELDFGSGWTASARTGYDILQADQGRVPWQIVSLRGGYRHGTTKFDISASYDTFNTNWGYVRTTGQFEWSGMQVAVGAKFDAARAIWSAGSLIVQGLKMGKLTADFLLSYNGFTQQFDAQQYTLRYDLHCTEAILEITDYRRGFRSGVQIAFYISIKALPFGTDFGVGRRGQSVGGVGGFGG